MVSTCIKSDLLQSIFNIHRQPVGAQNPCGGSLVALSFCEVDINHAARCTSF
jgi:hypothetical protein